MTTRSNRLARVLAMTPADFALADTQRALKDEARRKAQSGAAGPGTLQSLCPLLAKLVEADIPD